MGVSGYSGGELEVSVLEVVVGGWVGGWMGGWQGGGGG